MEDLTGQGPQPADPPINSELSGTDKVAEALTAAQRWRRLFFLSFGAVLSMGFALPILYLGGHVMETKAAATADLEPLLVGASVESKPTNLINNRSVNASNASLWPSLDGWLMDLMRQSGRAGPAHTAAAPRALAQFSTEPKRFAVQVGAFQDKSNAQRLRERMEHFYTFTRIVPRLGDPVLWRVLVVSEPNRADAEALAAKLEAETGDAFVAEAADDRAATALARVP